MSETLGKFDWRAQIFPKRNDLRDDLTTYDLVKAIAVILMIIDHVGFYLFPEIEWFRAIGRAGMPVWFFLVGYARAQDLPPRWLIAGIILLIANMFVGLSPLPLSALFTLALCRLLAKPFWDFVADRQVYFWWIVMLLLFFGPVTDMVFEYGTFGFLIAFSAYALRRRAEIDAKFESNPVRLMFGIVIGVFTLYEIMKFGFSPLAAMCTAAGLFGAYLVLVDFQPKVYAGSASQPQAPLMRFMGRYTLEIYVIHLLILKAVWALQNVAQVVVEKALA